MSSRTKQNAPLGAGTPKRAEFNKNIIKHNTRSIGVNPSVLESTEEVDASPHQLAVAANECEGDEPRRCSSCFLPQMEGDMDFIEEKQALCELPGKSVLDELGDLENDDEIRLQLMELLDVITEIKWLVIAKTERQAIDVD